MNETDNMPSRKPISNLEKRQKYMAARFEGHPVKQAARMAGISSLTAYEWEKIEPLEFIRICAKESGNITKEGMQIVLTEAGIDAPIQYKAALLRLLADIKGWTKPQAEETGDRAAERLKQWLTSIAAQAPKPEPQPEPPTTESPTVDDTTH